MAEESGAERTEAATARRLQQARDAGQVPLSREAAPLATLAAGTLLLMVWAPSAAHDLARTLAALLAQTDRLTPGVAAGLAGRATLRAAAPLAAIAALAASGAVLAQTGGHVHPGALLPDPARLDPRRGLARIASLAALGQAGKALAKLTAAGAAVWFVLRGAVPMLPTSLQWAPTHLLGESLRLVLRVLLTLLAAQAAVAAFDIAHTRIAHANSLRMTRQDVREEHKETEGDPHIKARIRKLRAQRARKRMMAAVPKAAVVVTNPTHYAVALAYQRGATSAPRVVAKGMDEIAERIRALAREHRVPIVANPPLARALHALEVDAEIPRELYQAVAELIAYIWRLRSRAA